MPQAVTGGGSYSLIIRDALGQGVDMTGRLASASFNGEVLPIDVLLRKITAEYEGGGKVQVGFVFVASELTTPGDG